MTVNAIRNGTASVPPVVVVPEDYLALIRQLPLLPISSAGVHRRALALANALLKKKAKSGELSRGEEGYLSVLLELIENYEKAKFPRRRLGDDEMLAHLIEAKGVSQTQIERATGIAAPTLSAVVAGRRRLTRDQVGKLSAYFGVAPTAFSFEALTGNHSLVLSVLLTSWRSFFRGVEYRSLGGVIYGLSRRGPRRVCQPGVCAGRSIAGS